MLRRTARILLTSTMFLALWQGSAAAGIGGDILDSVFDPVTETVDETVGTVSSTVETVTDVVASDPAPSLPDPSLDLPPVPPDVPAPVDPPSISEEESTSTSQVYVARFQASIEGLLAEIEHLLTTILPGH